MSRVLIESQYLPSIEFFCCISLFDTITIEQYENFQKQTYRNRCYILGANNVQALTIPVEKSNSKTLMKDLKVDSSQRWNHEHWRSIKSAYGKAPFFEYFAEYFSKHFENPPALLLDLNYEFLTLCLKLLQIDRNVELTKTFEKRPKSNISDLRSLITPKESFRDRSLYKPIEYLQVFGKDFVANMSIVDLLMNEGPNASYIVTKSAKTE